MKNSTSALARVAQLVGVWSPTPKRSRVRFPVSAHTKVAGSDPGWGTFKRQPKKKKTHKTIKTIPPGSMAKIHERMPHFP